MTGTFKTDMPPECKKVEDIPMKTVNNHVEAEAEDAESNEIVPAQAAISSTQHAPPMPSPADASSTLGELITFATRPVRHAMSNEMSHVPHHHANHQNRDQIDQGGSVDDFTTTTTVLSRRSTGSVDIDDDVIVKAVKVQILSIDDFRGKDRGSVLVSNL
jgi:hypothetical protein